MTHSFRNTASPKLLVFLFLPIILAIAIALVLQRRFLKLAGFEAEITSRTARPQSGEACELIAMRRCSRSLSYEPSL